MFKPDKVQNFHGEDEISMLRPEERVKCGLVRTFQINTLFPHLSALEAVTLAVCERRGPAGRRGGEGPPPGAGLEGGEADSRVLAVPPGGAPAAPAPAPCPQAP